MTYELAVNPPFDLELTLRHDQGHRWRPDPDDPGWYTSVVNGEFVRIRQEGGRDTPLEVDCPRYVLIELHWQFRGDEDISAIYRKLASGDPTMEALVGRFSGLRIMRVDPWECLVFFILSAHNHFRSHVATRPTASAMDEIASAFWEGEPQPHGRYHFPRPEILGTPAGLDRLNELWFGREIGPNPDDVERPRLRGLNDMPGRIHRAAWFASIGRLDELRGMSTREVVKTLATWLPGVGVKTAHCVALFGFGCLDAFPVDAHVMKALLSLYGRDPFQPHAGYASQFLFMEGLTIPSDQ